MKEIGFMAFCDSDLEYFVAPPSLRKIDALAFRDCCNLRRFELTDCIQELRWFCLWGTGVTDMRLLPHVRITREQLGLD